MNDAEITAEPVPWHSSSCSEFEPTVSPGFVWCLTCGATQVYDPVVRPPEALASSDHCDATSFDQKTTDDAAISRSVSPPPNEPFRALFDFTKLCAQWGRVDSPFLFRSSPWSQSCIQPSECDSHCTGCDILLRAVQQWRGQSKQVDRVSVTLRSFKGASFLSIAECFYERWSAVLCAVNDYSTHSLEHYQTARSFILTMTGTANPWNIRGPPSALSAGFSTIMDLVRHWLIKCIQTHAECGSGAESPLPTRILDLDSSRSDTIRLREAKGETGRYVCLTYCWGGSEFIKTTRETLERHKQGIGFEELSQSFLDTIQIARALGIRYLWVDALCIVQNDVNGADWKRESGRMADVYRNSYLTVAPTWADSANNGCFTTPKDDGVDIGPVTISPIHHFPHTATPENSIHFPLLARAWTYQERMLAPRVLHFGRQEMLWDCRNARGCECGRADYSLYQVQKSCFHDSISNFQSTKGYTPHKVWRQMVMEYSPLQLTYPTDKLPAFSGLADEMQRHSKQEYLAGLWRDTLIPDMCWYREYSKRPSPETAEGMPTWSWASIDGPVRYPRELWIIGQSNIADVEQCTDVEQYPEVLDAKCFVAGPSLLGQVDNGFVELRCCLIPADIWVQAKVGSLILRYYPDWRCNIEMLGVYYIIPMLTAGRYFYALVVQANPQDSNEVIRIGLAEQYMLEDGDIRWMVSQEKQRVRIV